MQSPMPLTTGASTALVSGLRSIASPPFPITRSQTSSAGLRKRIAKPQALGPCGGEVGGERIRILVDQEVDAALAVDGDRPRPVPEHRGETHPAEVACSSSPWPSGAANSTNSKPSIPIGFSKVVTCMPRLGAPVLRAACRKCARRAVQGMFRLQPFRQTANAAGTRGPSGMPITAALARS
jgi:hypothetical protein